MLSLASSSVSGCYVKEEAFIVSTSVARHTHTHTQRRKVSVAGHPFFSLLYSLSALKKLCVSVCKRVCVEFALVLPLVNHSLCVFIKCVHMLVCVFEREVRENQGTPERAPACTVAWRMSDRLQMRQNMVSVAATKWFSLDYHCLIHTDEWALGWIIQCLLQTVNINDRPPVFGCFCAHTYERLCD